MNTENNYFNNQFSLNYFANKIDTKTYSQLLIQIFAKFFLNQIKALLISAKFYRSLYSIETNYFYLIVESYYL